MELIHNNDLDQKFPLAVDCSLEKLVSKISTNNDFFSRFNGLILITDNQGNIEYCSKPLYFGDISQKIEQFLLHRNVLNINGIDQDFISIEVDQLLLTKVIQQGLVVRNVPINVVLTANDYRLMDFSSNPFVSLEGELIANLIFMQEQSIWRLMKEQEERNDLLSRLGEMAAGVVHEVRNPLQVIRSYTQIMQTKFADDEKVKGFLEIIISELDRSNDILTEFLRISRMDKVCLEPKDLNKICKDASVILKGFAIVKGIFIEDNYAETLPLVMIDEARIKQVLLNLVCNAIDASQNGATVHVSTKVSGNMVAISVVDHGCGMTEETIAQLSRPFFTTKDNGTGLGLPISFRVITEHGGKFKIDSKLGKGTIFTVYLPKIVMQE